MSSPSFRLAWLTENYPPSGGGMAQSCDRIVRSLRGSGVRIDLFHFSPRLHRWRVEEQHNGRYFACPMEADPAHALNRLWSRLESEGPDYTHVVAFGGTLPLTAGPVYAAWLGVPLVSLIRGNDFDTAVFDPRRVASLERALTHSAMVCAVSRDKAARIAALYPQAKVRWLPNGIDLDAWKAEPFDREAGRAWRERTVPDGRRVIGLFGHLKAKKGVTFFLEALLRSGHAEHFHLLLIGEPAPELQAWLETQGERLATTQLPFLDRYALLPYFTACDLIAIPSFYDGTPNVLLEALALGIPILGADTGGMSDWLREGTHGFLFTPGDPHSCRLAISRGASADAATLAGMGNRCRDLAAGLGAEREAEAYLQVLAETAGLPSSRYPEQPYASLSA